MSLEAKEFLDNKQEHHFKQFGVYADVNSKLAEWMQEYSDKEIILDFLKWIPNGIDDMNELLSIPKEIAERYIEENK